MGNFIEIRCDISSRAWKSYTAQYRVLWDSERINDIKKAASQNKRKKKEKEEEVSVANCIGLATCSNTDAWSNIVIFFSLDKPENLKFMVNDSVVCKGDVISITCSADGKPAVHTYQMFENEILVNDGNSSAAVWIRKYLKEGDFSYKCVANNTVGTAEKTVNVTVKGTV